MFNNEYENTKKQIAENLGINYNTNSNGDMKTRDAGRIGGVIGGNMVKTLIYIAEQNLIEEYQNAKNKIQ